MAICGQNTLASCKGAHQHQQTRLWEMEIGEQRANQLESEARSNKDFRRSRMRDQRPVASLERVRRGGFQGAYHRGSYRDDSPALTAARLMASAASAPSEYRSRWSRTSSTRSTRSGAKVPSPTCNVTRAVSTPNAVKRASIAGVKCSPAVGAATDPRSSRVHRLVTLAIRGNIVAMDVWRQRNMADAIEACVKILHRLELEQPFAKFSPLQHFGLQFDRPAWRGKYQPAPRWRPCARVEPAPATGSRRLARSASPRFARSASPSRAAACAARKAAPESRGCRSAPADRLARSSDGKSANILSSSAPVARSMTSMRLGPRSAGGCCAISSSGRSKSKSATRSSHVCRS